jgi:hypothetical protein
MALPVASSRLRWSVKQDKKGIKLRRPDTPNLKSRFKPQIMVASQPVHVDSGISARCACLPAPCMNCKDLTQ